MPITLRNKSKRIRTYNLARGVVGLGMKPAQITQFSVATNTKGDKAMTPRNHTVPAVLTLLPGETKKDLPDSILKTKVIAREIANPRSGLVLVKQTGPKKTSKPATSAAAPTKAAKKTSKKRARSSRS